MVILTIENISIEYNELLKQAGQWGIKRTVHVKPQDEIQLGFNKNFFPVNIRSRDISYKHDFSALVSQQKFNSLSELYTQQKQEKLFNFNVGDSVTTVLYPLTSCFSKHAAYGMIDSFEVNGSRIQLGNLVYEITMSIIEISNR
jgi:hypothetical protein